MGVVACSFYDVRLLLNTEVYLVSCCSWPSVTVRRVILGCDWFNIETSLDYAL